MNAIDLILDDVRKTNPQMTKEHLIDVLKTNRYSSTSLLNIVLNSTKKHPTISS